MLLPDSVRRLAPTRMRDSERLRSFALGAGLIPPRPMHTDGEAELLGRLAQGRATVVEIGTYEGSSAVVLAESMSLDATLHLIDSYEGNALLFGWQGTERATRRLMDRVAAERGGPRVQWHVARSGDVARRWSGDIDFLFIDADHTEAGARADWDAFSGFVVEGGVVAFHDARSGHPGGPHAHPGPTAVVDSLFRSDAPLDGWRIVDEVDSVVAVERTAAS